MCNTKCTYKKRREKKKIIMNSFLEKKLQLITDFYCTNKKFNLFCNTHKKYIYKYCDEKYMIKVEIKMKYLE